MPKIKDYEKIKTLSPDNMFITEQLGKQTCTISFQNLLNGIIGSGRIESPDSSVSIKVTETSSDPENDSYYKLYLSGLNFRNGWDADISVKRNDLLAYTEFGSKHLYYRSSSKDKTASTWEEDKSNWTLLGGDVCCFYELKPDKWSESKPYTYIINGDDELAENASVVIGWYTGDIDSYNCLTQVKIDNRNKKITFICDEKKPTKTFQVNAKINYSVSTIPSIIVPKYVAPADTITNSENKTWSIDKIISTIKDLTGVVGLDVLSLPEVGAKGIIYRRLLNEEGIFNYGSYKNYKEFIWVDSMYKEFGDNTSCYLLLSALPDAADKKNISYLIPKTSETLNNYNSYIWNDITSSFDLKSSFNFEEDQQILFEIICPSHLFNSSSSTKISSGVEKIVYLEPKTSEDESVFYDMKIWDTTNGVFESIGNCSTRPTAMDTSAMVETQIIFKMSKVPNGFEGIEGIIYTDTSKRYIWSSKSNSFVLIGSGSYYSSSISFDTSNTSELPETGSSKYVYCITNTEDTAKYDLYAWIGSDYPETPYIKIGQAPISSIT